MIDKEAQSTAEGDAAGATATLRIARTLGFVVCLTLLALYLLGWVLSVQGYGGLERFARFTDFIATPTGAQIVANGQGAMLYDLPTQQETQWSIVSAFSRRSA